MTTDDPKEAQVELSFAPIPMEYLPNGVKVVEDVEYGPHHLQSIDLLLPASDSPLPVLIELHGGGWRNGDKKQLGVYRGLMEKTLEAGIAVAAANYRLIPGAVWPAQAEDAVRIVQFIRFRAREWNLDPSRVGLIGGSAGAHLCVWVAAHDDFSNPSSADVVEHESSRVSCVIDCWGPMDLMRMDMEGRGREIFPQLFDCQPEDWETPDLRILRREASPINYVKEGMPPVLIVHDEPEQEIPETGLWYAGGHSALFGQLLKGQLEKVGSPVEAAFEATPAIWNERGLAFLRKHLGVEPQEESMAPTSESPAEDAEVAAGALSGHPVLDRASYHAVYDDSILDALKYAKANGFRGIQVADEAPRLSLENMQEEDIEEIRELVDSQGLTISLHAQDDAASLFQCNSHLRKGVVRYYSALFDFADSIGAHIVTIHLGSTATFPTDTEPEIARAEEDLAIYKIVAMQNIEALIQKAAGRFALCVENYGLDETSMGILARFLNEETICLCWDVAKSFGDEKMEEFLLSHLGQVKQVHLHDIGFNADGQRRSHRVIGSGRVDFTKYIEILKRSDVLEYCIEVRPREKAKESLEALRELVLG